MTRLFRADLFRSHSRLACLMFALSVGLMPLSGCLFVAGRRSDGHWFFWPFGLLLLIPLWFGMRRRR